MSAEILVEISKIEALLSIVGEEYKKSLTKFENFKNELVTVENELEKKKILVRELKHKQVGGEANLKAEELKVADRRRQLMQMGQKASKHLERDLEVTKRQLETLEEDLLKLISLTEDEDRKLKDLGLRHLDLEISKDDELPRLELKIIDKKLEYDNLKARIDEKLNLLEDKIKSSYLRIKTKYPRNPVAYTKNGVCTACSRTLPAQIARIEPSTCPGCGRILVQFRE